MTPARRDEDGIPHSRRTLVARPGSAPIEETWRGANDAKAEKLRRNNLQRLARTRGLELRHSAYGYSLIDTARKPIDARNNMTLDEIESWLQRS